MKLIDALKRTGFSTNGEVQVLSTFRTTLSALTIVISAEDGKTLLVNWGDSTPVDVYIISGGGASVVHNYGSTGDRLITFGGSANETITLISAETGDIIELDISNNTQLVTLNLIQNNVVTTSSSGLVALNIDNNILLTDIDCKICELPTSEINAHLSALVANGLNNGVYDGSGQFTTSAPPTGQGITDKATLITRGWTVTTD